MNTTQFKSNFDLIEIGEVIIGETKGTNIVSPLVFADRLKDLPDCVNSVYVETDSRSL
jgi:hypothetical protein